MSDDARVYDWIEFDWRPKREGLHDSGYRYLRCYGARRENGEIVKDPLNQWADHIELGGPVNIDVEPDGTIRIMSRAGGWLWEGYPGSDAVFIAADSDKAVKQIQLDAEFRRRFPKGIVFEK